MSLLGRTPRVCCAILAMLAGLGFGPPEVVKVRVPASKVERWFPPGSNLQILTPVQLDDLIRAAGAREPAPRPPRILRASHSARWESGFLIGRSEFEVEPLQGGTSALVILEPWSPALPTRGAGADQARETEDGRLGLRIAPGGPARLALDWQMRARPGSSGRAFALALPDVATASLELNLPQGLIPEGAPGTWMGPDSSSRTPEGPTSWTLPTAGGRIPLRLRDRLEDGTGPGSPRLWLEGGTAIDLNASPANWKAEWTLEEVPGAPDRLTIVLDPGLELIDVTGPKVSSYRIEPGSSPPRVTIRLGGEASNPSPLTIRALCHPPDEGPWSIPSATPVDATWTGGRTTVRLDPGRVLQGCVEKAGRRIASRSSDPSRPLSLEFEPGGEPGPLAELTFRRPSAEATVEVRGHLNLGDDPPRIAVALTWSTEKGRLPTHAADLPPGWTPDRVLGPSGESVAWHAEPIPGGGLRTRMSPPSTAGEARSLTMTLVASCRGAGRAGPLDLPRVRTSPTSGRVVDETWVATAPPGLDFRPTLGRGLAWIDAPDPAREAGPAPWAGSDLDDALAWRWLVDDAEARVDRVLVRERPKVQARLDASVVPDRLRLDWTLTFDDLGGGVTSIPIHLSEPVAAPIRWRIAGSNGPTIEAHPIEERRRAALGLPPGGTALELDLTRPRRGRIELEGHAEAPWGGKGRLPLLTLAKDFRVGGLVAIRTDDTVRLRVEPAGPTPVDLSDRPSESAEGRPVDRRASLFRYGETAGVLGIETTRGELGPTGGVIREAVLTTQVHPGVGLRHRLVLRVAVDSARDLALTMPDGVEVDRIRRDGQPTDAISDGRSIRVALSAPGTGRDLATIAIDYRSAPPAGRISRASPTLPACSMACLSFVWEIVAPEPWSIRDIPDELVDTDPRPGRSWVASLLGIRFEPPGLLGGRRPSADQGPTAGELDKLVAGPASEDMTLGEWLLKLDSGRWPVVVDRLALLSAGLGPASRVGGLPGSPGASPSVGSTLGALGLVANPIEGMVLVSTRADSPDRAATFPTWSPPLRRASASGSDESDRFQSASRWRGEATPRAAGAGETSDRLAGRAGWVTRRLVRAGWPSPAASVSFVDERTESVRGWLVASIVLTIGVLTRRQPRRARGVGLGLALALAGFGLAWGWPDPPAWLTGGLRGLIAVFALWLARAARFDGSRDPTPDEIATPSRSGLGARVATLMVVSGLVGLWVNSTIAGPDLDAPILALLPFDGPPDPSSGPDRVVMLLEDHERLRRLAEPAKAVATGRVLLIASGYRVRREGPGSASVESRFELEVEGDGASSWSVPVGEARDISAMVADRPTPILIAKEGLLATIPLPGPGIHTIRVRGSVPLSAVGPGGKRLRHPIARAAFAKVEVGRDARGGWVDVAEASGRVEIGGGEVRGTIGPVDTLDVRWFADDRPQSGAPRGPVEATMLWDARPVGDLLRVRLTHADPDGASTIRLALEPGLLVRSASIPDLVGIRHEGTAEHPVWVAQVDPPWPRDLPIEVDLWRARPRREGLRRIPRVEVPDASRFSGVVGFRRPSDWSGRLEPSLGLDPVLDSSFVRTWGTLPDDGLTLAGSVRFGSMSALALATGPVPLRRTIRTRMAVDLEPGRLNASIEGLLSDRQGRSFAVELALPAEFRIVRVEAAGMVDWQRLARDRLRVQFDGSERPDRPIRVRGYVSVPAEPALVELRNYQAKIPWPQWVDAEAEPGTLVVSGPVRFQMETGEGVSSVLAHAPASTEAGAAFRTAYQVEEPEGLGPIRWASPRSRVVVSVRSDLTIDASRVAWTAVVDGAISGGPAESLVLNVPTEWARNGELEVDGRPIRPTSEARGDLTTWRIQPESPLWRRARMVIRSWAPLVPERAISFPEVSPLAVPGRGALGRYDLAIANVSGRPIELAGSPGLQAIDVAQYRSAESPAPPGSIDRAYRVTGEHWSLKVAVGGEPRAGTGSSREATRVAWARLRGSLGPGGELTGGATYELKPRPGPYLALKLPDAGDLPWASVDGLAAPVLRDGPGRWLVAIRNPEARRVEVCYIIPSDIQARDRLGGVIGWPSTGSNEFPSSIRLDAPRSIEIGGEVGSLRRVSAGEAGGDEVEQLARRVADALLDLDRTSSGERGEILRDLVEFELADRAARRGLEAQPLAKESVEARIQAARATIDESSQLAGMEQLTEEARSRVGLGNAPATQLLETRADPVEPTRIRRLGRPHFFLGDGKGPLPPPSMTWSLAKGEPDRRSAVPWLIGSVGCLVATVAGLLIARPSGVDPGAEPGLAQ